MHSWGLRVSSTGDDGKPRAPQYFIIPPLVPLFFREEAPIGDASMRFTDYVAFVTLHLAAR